MRPSPYICTSCLRTLRHRQSSPTPAAALIHTRETKPRRVNHLNHPDIHRYARKKHRSPSPASTSHAVEHRPSADLPPPAFDIPAIASQKTHQFHPVHDDAIHHSSPRPKKPQSKSPPHEPPPPTALASPLLPTTALLSHHPSPLAPPPTTPQLTHTQAFFHNATKRLLFSVPDFYLTPVSSMHPEVAFLGRSNVGKSTLLNAVMGAGGLARTSAKPGKTRLLNGYWVGGEAGKGIRGLGSGSTNKRTEGRSMGNGKGGLVILDMPGYGHGSRAEWGHEIVRYLRGRKQLRRVFLLIDPLHGPLETDIQTLSLLSTHCIATQIVLSKVDRVIAPSLLSVAGPSLIAPSSTPAPAPALHEKRMALQSAFREVAEGIMTRILRKAAAEDGRGRLVGLVDEVVGVGMGLGDSNPKAKRNKGSRTVGVMELRWAVLRACGLDGG